MADLLSGLRTFFLGDDGLMHEVTSAQSGRYAPVGPWLVGSDVRGALSNPTDEVVARLAGDIGVVGAAQQMGRGALPEPLARNRREALVRAVLAAAAGGRR